MIKDLGARIQRRLDELGKNPSSVALEAGLGRSSVRDIILGRAAHPRMDTLLKLTGPLQCSIDYLLGEQGDGELLHDFIAEFDPAPGEIMEVLRAGVYKSTSEITQDEVKTLERFMTYKDLRFPDRLIFEYVMGDDSMEAIGILKGDVVSAVDDGAGGIEDPISLTEGKLVIAHVSLDNPRIHESSLRAISLQGDEVHLICKSRLRKFDPIVLGRQPRPELPNGYRNAEDNAAVLLMGTAVRVRRQLPA